jgi:hypothetical protein
VTSCHSSVSFVTKASPRFTIARQDTLSFLPMSEPEKKGSETKERNVCCHYCRISQYADFLVSTNIVN